MGLGFFWQHKQFSRFFFVWSWSTCKYLLNKNKHNVFSSQGGGWRVCTLVCYSAQDLPFSSCIFRCSLFLYVCKTLDAFSRQNKSKCEGESLRKHQAPLPPGINYVLYYYCYSYISWSHKQIWTARKKLWLLFTVHPVQHFKVF